MKILRPFITTGALTALGASLALGQATQQEGQQPGQPGAQEQQPEVEQFEAHRISDLKGSRVVNQEGDRLGTLDDITIELEDGVFSYAIISAGGFLGIGGDLRPVPAEAFETREVAIGLELVLDIPEDRWDAAPTIERDQMHLLTQEVRAQEIYEFYGQDWEARQEQITEFAGADREHEGTENGEPGAETAEIEQQLQQAMTEAGVDQQQAEQEAQRLAQQFEEESPDQQEIQQELEQALTQAGVDQEQAQQQAQQLAGQIHQQMEFAAPDRDREMQQEDHGQQQQQQPGAGMEDGQQQQQQIQQQLEQAMTEAGVDEQQAQQEAERLSQQFAQDRPEQEEIQRELEQALTGAGVDEQQAQEQSEQLAGQIHQQIEFGAPGREQEMQQQDQQQQQQPGAQTEEQNEDPMELGAEQLQTADQINLASDLMDANLVDRQQQELGEISDFLVSLQEGRVAMALVTTDTGFFEMTDEEYAVSPRAFEVSGNRLILNVTQQDLETAESIRPAQLQERLEELAQVSADEARESPQVFRYQDQDVDPDVFGDPDRDRQQEGETHEEN